MNKNRTLHFFAAIALALLLLPAAAFAQGPPDCDRGGRGHHGPPGGPVKMFEHHAEEIGLDDADLMRIKAIFDASKDEMMTLKESLHDSRAKLRSMMDADTPDEQAIMAQIDTITAISGDLHRLRVKTMLDIRATLTPDQREKMKALHEARRERHKNRRHEFKKGDGAP